MYVCEKRDKENQKETEEGRRDSRCHTRVLRHFDTSNTSDTSFSCSSFFFTLVTPISRFSLLASIPSPFFSRAHFAHSLANTRPRRLLTEGASRTDSIVLAAKRFCTYVREHSFPRGTRRPPGRALDRRIPSFLLFRSSLSLPRATNFRETALRRTETALQNRNKERRSRVGRPWRSHHQSTGLATISSSECKACALYMFYACTKPRLFLSHIVTI